FSLGRIGKPADYGSPKLLSPGEFKLPHFAISLDDSLFPCARIIGVSCVQVPIAGLQKLLNSRFAGEWFRANLPPKGGGFRGMSVGDLARFPVPEKSDPIWSELDTAETFAAANVILDKWAEGVPI